MSETINAIKKLDKEKIIRPGYGEASLLTWEPEYANMLNKLRFVQKYWSKVDGKTNQQVQNALNNILSILQQIISADEAFFVSNKQQLIRQISDSFNEIKQHYPKYAVEALDESGLLENSDLKSQVESLTTTLTTTLKNSTEDALKDIELASEKIIENTTKKANDIDFVVRQTAEHISVQEAQNQFKNAAQNNKKNVIVWGCITIFLVIIFSISVICMLNANLPDQWTWKMIYFSGLRIAILGFIGTLLAFSLKMLKSYLHMKEHNLHRQRIANSMASFAESATSKEQRDLILSRLIDSVSTFGNSGMVNNDEDNNSKITIDNITRTLSALKPGAN